MAQKPSKSTSKAPVKKTSAKKTNVTKTSATQSSETKLIKELAQILQDTDLSEIEMEKGNLRLRVARQSGAVTMMASAPVAAAPVVAPIAAAPSAAVSSATEPTAVDDANAVKSPMVGTAYIRPSPEADPFIAIGSSVSEGDTVVLIEAMKTFNPIKAPRSGKITAILVEDGQPVEFGEPLLVIQ